MNKIIAKAVASAFVLTTSSSYASPPPNIGGLPPVITCAPTSATYQTFAQQANDGGWNYTINVFAGNTQCPTSGGPASSKAGFISDVYFPFFSDSGIENISVGDLFSTWTFAIESQNDLFGLGGGALHFNTSGTPATVPFQAFTISFSAPYGTVSAPYSKTFFDSDVGNFEYATGIDLGVGSPMERKALGLDTASVPEPASLMLFGLGAVAFGAFRRKHRGIYRHG